MKFRIVKSIFAAATVAVAFSASAKELSGPVKIDGSSTVFPITEAVAEEFQNAHPKTRVTVGVSGTGGGMKKFTVGETDISNASRPIKDKEAAKATKNGITFMQLTVAFDGLSVVVSKKSPLKDVTIAELKALWQPDSKIKTWSQFRKGLPAKPIKLYGPGPDSGTFDYFTEEVVGKSRASRSDYTASEDDNVLVRGLGSDPYALGYFGYSYYIENKNTLRALAINGITPDMKTIESSKYPLSRPLFIYVSSAGVKKPQVVEFINFYLKNAPTLAKQVGYTPLPSKDYKAMESKFATFVQKHANKQAAE